MGSHNTHNMHDNSLEAWHYFDMSNREREVCEVYQLRGWMTDREVCTALGSADMNHARPAITALILAGTLVEHPDKWPCNTTHRHVRKCNFAPYPVYIKPIDEQRLSDLDSHLAMKSERDALAGQEIRLTSLLATARDDMAILRLALVEARRLARTSDARSMEKIFHVVDKALGTTEGETK